MITKTDMVTHANLLNQRCVYCLMEQAIHDRVPSLIQHYRDYLPSKSKRVPNVHVRISSDQLKQSDHYFSTLSKHYYR